MPHESNRQQPAARAWSPGGRACLWICLLVPFWTGCAAARPLQGFPAGALPDEHRFPSRSIRQTIDLSLLRQTPPPEHLVDTGDVLGIYVEGILGREELLPPVHFPHDRELPPALGYPVPVRGDGTISLPHFGSVYVRGMTLSQVEEALRRTAMQGDQPLLQPTHNQILVSLHKPRTCRVLVIRQEAGNSQVSQGFQNIQSLALPHHAEKRGIGRVVHLPAYRNDVLNALAETGGLPGLDAENSIYVMRRTPQSSVGPLPPTMPMQPFSAPPALEPAPAPMPVLPFGAPNTPAPPGIPGPALPGSVTPGAVAPPPPIEQTAGRQPEPLDWGHSIPAWPHAPVPMPHEYVDAGPGTWPVEMAAIDPTINNPHVLKIPLRLAPGEVPLFTEPHILLHDGDVVYIESREWEYFTTGGLLGGGRYILPRDFDLDVVEAVAMAEAQTASYGHRPTRAIGGVSALNQDVTVGASRVVILRRLPNGGHFPITVDLYQAVRNPWDRVVIQPGDHLVLQYSRGEAFLAFFERHILEGAVIGAASSLVFGR